ncbi:MAG: hypothetical protein ACLP1X_08850 [Polyangiaceae bacterium]
MSLRVLLARGDAQVQGDALPRGAAPDSEKEFLERSCRHRRRASLAPPEERAAGRKRRRNEHIETD